MLADELSKLWHERRASTCVDATMRFSDEGLVLGAGTVLVAAGASGRDIVIDPLEPTLSALLTAAHLRRPTFSALVHLRKAAEWWFERQDALACMHLVLSGLDRLEQPDADAQRLFLADGLLKAGFPTTAIFGAVESSFPETRQLDKYSPDQPRVPPGNGRTSGQWTSTGGGPPSDLSVESDPSPRAAHSPTSVPDANAPQPLADPPQPEVNQNTVTQVADPRYETPQACDVATVHCIDAAVEASLHDPANDNGPRNLDLNSCRLSRAACYALDIAIQMQPFPLSGGVRFPHGGVVLIAKDQVDRYVPPRPGGRSPSLKRKRERAGESPLRKNREIDSYSFPPQNPASDEISSSYDSGFNVQEQLIRAFSAKLGGNISKQTYSKSNQWGSIIRAKITFERDGSSATALLTCWSSSGSNVHFDLILDGCGDCGAQ